MAPKGIGQGKRMGGWVFLPLSLLFLTAFSPALHAESAGPRQAEPDTVEGQYNCGALAFEFVGNASVVAEGDWLLLNQTILDTCVGNADVVMFAVWKIPSGQTIAVETAGANMTAGEMLNFYVPIFNINPGTYSVFLFGVSVPNNVPVSFALKVQITLN
jgi:hypothetical protein